MQCNEDLKCHYKADMLVFADETGFDWRNNRRKGYSLRGKPAISKQLIVRGVHVSVIAAISSKGLLDFKIHRGGGIDSNAFCDFVTKQLLLHLYPFNGSITHTLSSFSITAVFITQTILF